MFTVVMTMRANAFAKNADKLVIETPDAKDSGIWYLLVLGFFVIDKQGNTIYFHTILKHLQFYFIKKIIPMFKLSGPKTKCSAARALTAQRRCRSS